MKAELVPENGDEPIPILKDVTVIGRKECCDVMVDHPSLSKRHCVLVKTDGLLVIRDLVSTNGTKVKGVRVRWAALLPDDKLSLGGYKVKVYLGPDTAPSPSERRSKKGLRPSSIAGPAGQGVRTPGFAAPSPLGTPLVAAPSLADDRQNPDWKNLNPAAVPPRLMDAELIDDDDIIDLDDDIIELE